MDDDNRIIIQRVDIFNNGNGRPDYSFEPNHGIEKQLMNEYRRWLIKIYGVKIDPEAVKQKIEVVFTYKQLPNSVTDVL